MSAVSGSCDLLWLSKQQFLMAVQTAIAYIVISWLHNGLSLYSSTCWYLLELLFPRCLFACSRFNTAGITYISYHVPNTNMRCICSAGSEIRQILQGVTEWIATMVDDQADPFGDLAAFEQSGEMSSITAHVAEVISQMAGTLNDLGASEDMDVEITYEFDLAVRTDIVSFWYLCFVCK